MNHTRELSDLHTEIQRIWSVGRIVFFEFQLFSLLNGAAHRQRLCKVIARQMSVVGHSRPGRASNKSGHVGYAPKAQVIQSICIIIEALAAAQLQRFPDAKLIIDRSPPYARAARRSASSRP